MVTNVVDLLFIEVNLFAIISVYNLRHILPRSSAILFLLKLACTRRPFYYVAVFGKTISLSEIMQDIHPVQYVHKGENALPNMVVCLY